VAGGHGGAGHSPEDAFADLDATIVDVSGCCEGRRNRFFQAPRERSRYLDPTGENRALPASKGVLQWMFCLPMQVMGATAVDLVSQTKNEACQVGWFEAPPDAHDLPRGSAPVYDAGWIMSLISRRHGCDGIWTFCIGSEGSFSRCCDREPGSSPGDAGRWPYIGSGGRS
jgi:hypothetical protein